jgi:hypothetical protein
MILRVCVQCPLSYIAAQSIPFPSTDSHGSARRHSGMQTKGSYKFNRRTSPILTASENGLSVALNAFFMNLYFAGEEKKLFSARAASSGREACMHIYCIARTHPELLVPQGIESALSFCFISLFYFFPRPCSPFA